MQTREINFAINASKNIVAEWKTAVSGNGKPTLNVDFNQDNAM